MQTIPANPKHHAKRSLLLFRQLAIIIFLFLSIFCAVKSVRAQGNLVIPSRSTYHLDRDTLIAAAITLGDSSTLVFTKQNTFIKVGTITAGHGSRLLGKGEKGVNGKNGASPAHARGYCTSGGSGEAGKNGTDGMNGKNVTLIVNNLSISTMLYVDLNGGNGGDGGRGGNGSNGSTTTVHCAANGGNGGEGGHGGNGGNGGNIQILIDSKTPAELVSKITLTNRGGYRGLGGEGGHGGHRGLGAGESKSKIGSRGKNGADGLHGEEGKPLFYSISKATDTTLAHAAAH